MFIFTMVWTKIEQTDFTLMLHIPKLGEYVTTGVKLALRCAAVLIDRLYSRKTNFELEKVQKKAKLSFRLLIFCFELSNLYQTD